MPRAVTASDASPARADARSARRDQLGTSYAYPEDTSGTSGTSGGDSEEGSDYTDFGGSVRDSNWTLDPERVASVPDYLTPRMPAPEGTPTKDETPDGPDPLPDNYGSEVGSGTWVKVSVLMGHALTPPYNQIQPLAGGGFRYQSHEDGLMHGWAPLLNLPGLLNDRRVVSIVLDGTNPHLTDRAWQFAKNVTTPDTPYEGEDPVEVAEQLSRSEFQLTTINEIMAHIADNRPAGSGKKGPRDYSYWTWGDKDEALPEWALSENNGLDEGDTTERTRKRQQEQEQEAGFGGYTGLFLGLTLAGGAAVTAFRTLR